MRQQRLPPAHAHPRLQEQATKAFLRVLGAHLGGDGSGDTSSSSSSSSSSTVGSRSQAGGSSGPTSLLGNLRPYFITNISGGRRTATLMKDWVLEGTAPRDRPFIKAFLDTQMFEVHSDRLVGAVCEGRVD